MFVITASFHVRREHIPAFITASLDDARGSVRDEPGCVRFDMVQDSEDESRFLFFELYHDEAAFEQHRTMPHFLRWNETIRDWLVAPAQVMRGRTLFLTEEAS